MADLESGWFIGGNDVKSFPDPENHPGAANFVRDKVRAGHLEPASKAEYDEVQKAAQELSDMHLRHLDEHEAHDRSGHQEQHYQDLGKEHRQKLTRLRADNAVDDEEAYEEETAGYHQAQGGAEGPTDADVSPTGAMRPRAATAEKAAGARKSTKAKESEES
jgi:hypothetical protein